MSNGIALIFRGQASGQASGGSTLIERPPLPAADLRPIVAETTETKESRNQRVDVVRFFAAAAIVFCHVSQSHALDNWTNLFRFAVPFYLFASLYFQSLTMQRHPDRSFLQYVGKRVKRLYFPFLAWSLIYLIVRDLKRVTLLHLPPIQLTPSLLWKGTEYHLWFLPLLLAASIVFAAVHWTLLRFDRRWRWPLIAVAVLAGLMITRAPIPIAWDQPYDNPTYTLVQWDRALPATCWAMAFAWFMTAGPVVLSVPPIIGSAGLLLTVSCLMIQALRGFMHVPRALSGLGSFLVALAPWNVCSVGFLARLGRYGYGVYLCHVLVVELLHVIVVRGQFAPTPMLDGVMFALSLAGSFALVHAFDRSPRLAWLNG